MKAEKGIFSLLEIYEKLKEKIELTMVGNFKDSNEFERKINLINYVNNPENLAKIYDSHNIIILPSFTEGHPLVVDESLKRFRPVLVFKEIAHVAKNREGVFVTNRDYNSVNEIIDHILKNYEHIQKKMINNKIPTKSKFISQLIEIIDNKQNTNKYGYI